MKRAFWFDPVGNSKRFFCEARGVTLSQFIYKHYSEESRLRSKCHVTQTDIYSAKRYSAISSKFAVENVGKIFFHSDFLAVEIFQNHFSPLPFA